MKQVPLYFPPINKLGNVAFREVCLDFGADLVFTEMVRCEKILEDEEYQLKKLYIPESQREKTIVQIIAENVENIEKAINKILEINPFLKEINYNMGCPQSTLCKNENGGGIVGNSDKVERVAKILFKSCKKCGIDASIKIRLGLTRDDITIYENVKRIHNSGIKKVYIHGRTLSDNYNKPATYEEIAKVKNMFPSMQIIGNGDVKDSQSLSELTKQTLCDGVLVGRAALENPRIFEELKNKEVKQNLSGTEIKERKYAILEFLKYAKKYDISLSHASANIAYMTKGVIKAAEYRKEINNAKSIDEFIEITEKQ